MDFANETDSLELRKIMLEAINSDRKKYGLKPVSLSDNKCGQQHAERMVTERFFSHWDTKGLKPLARYNLTGGHAYVAENVAVAYWTSEFMNKNKPIVNQAGIIKNLKNIEYDFIYNDAFHGNGHRDNILNRYHNRISLGVSVREVKQRMENFTVLVVVQDFEDYFTKTSVKESEDGIEFRGEKSESVNISYGIILESGYDSAPSWTPSSRNIIEVDSRQSYSDGEPIAAITKQNMLLSMENGKIIRNLSADIEDIGDRYRVFISKDVIRKVLQRKRYYSITLYDNKYRFPLASDTLFL